MVEGPDAGRRGGVPVPRWPAVVGAAVLLSSPLAGQESPAGADSASVADSPASGPLRVLDVPYLPQSEALCGGAAAAMVMRYWGDAGVRPEAFSGLVRPAEGGIRPGELTVGIRDRGWRAERVGDDLDAVRDHLEEGRPVILLIRVGEDRFHYVTAVAARGGEWLVHDPARAPYRRLRQGELLERWEPSGRWGLVVVPERELVPERAGDAPDRAGDAPSPSPGTSDGAASGGEARCGGRVAAGVRAAREGRSSRADSLLRRAVRDCPDAPAPRRELAGLRFRQERWEASASLAGEALATAPDDVHALRTLAAARFMAGDEVGALTAWNRLDEPRLTGLRVYGLRRTRYRPLRRQTGLSAGRVLTRGDLRAARRRVAALPSVASSRVGYRPPADGATELEVALVERPLLPSSPAALAGLAVWAAAERELRARVASPTGGGELWTASWSWWEERPHARIGLAAPGVLGVPGVWAVDGLWRRAAFRVGSEGSDGAGGQAATADGGEPSGGVAREERRSAGLSVVRWITGSLRLGAAASLDDWNAAGRRAGLVLQGEVRPEAGVAVRAAAGGWAGPGDEFWRTGLEAKGRWSGPGPLGIRVGAGLEAAGTHAPRMLWPGAGTGRARGPLLRAHPLVRDGVVTGPAFGRVLAHAGVEPAAELPLSLPLSLQAAAFVDAARAWKRDLGGRDFGDGRLLVDVGGGLRLRLPGIGGRLRLDAAVGVADGAEAVSLGWEPPWPGWGRSAHRF